MAKLTKIKNKQGDTIYPETNAKVVYVDTDNGSTTTESELKRLETLIGNGGNGGGDGVLELDTYEEINETHSGQLVKVLENDKLYYPTKKTTTYDVGSGTYIREANLKGYPATFHSADIDYIKFNTDFDFNYLIQNYLHGQTLVFQLAFFGEGQVMGFGFTPNAEFTEILNAYIYSASDPSYPTVYDVYDVNRGGWLLEEIHFGEAYNMQFLFGNWDNKALELISDVSISELNINEVLLGVDERSTVQYINSKHSSSSGRVELSKLQDGVYLLEGHFKVFPEKDKSDPWYNPFLYEFKTPKLAFVKRQIIDDYEGYREEIIIRFVGGWTFGINDDLGAEDSDYMFSTLVIRKDEYGMYDAHIENFAVASRNEVNYLFDELSKTNGRIDNIRPIIKESVDGYFSLTDKLTYSYNAYLENWKDFDDGVQGEDYYDFGGQFTKHEPIYGIDLTNFDIEGYNFDGLEIRLRDARTYNHLYLSFDTSWDDYESRYKLNYIRINGDILDVYLDEYLWEENNGWYNIDGYFDKNTKRLLFDIPLEFMMISNRTGVTDGVSLQVLEKELDKFKTKEVITEDNIKEYLDTYIGDLLEEGV